MPRNTIDDDDDTVTLIDPTPGDPHVDREGQVEDNGNTPDPEPTTGTAPAPAAADGEGEGEGEGTDGKAMPRMIPKARFDEVNTRMQTLAEQNQALLDALARANGGAAAPGAPAAAAPAAPAAPAFDLKAAVRAKNEALAMGDDAKADELELQISNYLMEQAEQRALQRLQQQQQQDAAQAQATALQRVGAEVKAKYPQLDGKSDQADEDAITFVIAKRDALIAQGKSAADALRDASELAAKRFGFAASSASPTTDIATARTIQARTRNAQAAAAQPPDLPGVGNRAANPQKLNVEQMSEEEFAALPEIEKKRLRGDM